MFWRVVHLCAIAAIVGSAIYAYTIKYDTIWHGEQVAKLRHDIGRERDEIAALKAEWARLARPERIQKLAAALPDMQPLSLDQIGRIADLPDRATSFDGIGRKLELLGLAEPTQTPGAEAQVDVTPPATTAGRVTAQTTPTARPKPNAAPAAAPTPPRR
jgi:hypothetical protein